MVIITRSPDYQVENCLVAHSLEEALGIAEQAGESEAFVIGGGQIFAQALPLTDRIYLTRVETVSEADVFFPEFNARDWDIHETFEFPADEKNQFPSKYQLLIKRPHQP